MARGQFRIYLGAAPGVGKTFAMLEEAQRRAGRGTDLVIGFVETHGRQHTAEMVDDLEVVPRREMSYRGARFTEMDVDAILARNPQVAVVDELAHTNVPGSRNEKRWQDIQELLEAGITVLSTVNIQHLESLNDVVEQITGVVQRETVPDSVVRGADQVELADMTPEALRRRMVHGNVYPSEKVDAALGNYFRVGNLTALRELALLWLADKVDEQLDRYREEHGIGTTWEARERVVVALTGGREGDTLIRRAARIAARSKGADLLAVHVSRSDGLVDADPALLSRQRLLVESLGGTYHQVVGPDVPRALLDFALGVNATQLVLGASRRGRLQQLFSAGVGVTTTAQSGPIDVHLVTHEEVGAGRRRFRRGGAALSRRRRIAGYLVALIGLPALTAILVPFTNDLSLATDLMLFLLWVIIVSLVGGRWPAIATAVVGFLLLNYFFTPPLRKFTVNDTENLLALAVFVVVAIAVSAVVDTAATRTREAAGASADAQTLATVAGSVLRGVRPMEALLRQLREMFGLESVTLLERAPGSVDVPDRRRDPAAWRVAAIDGTPPSRTPAEGTGDVPIGDDLALVLRGHTLEASDRRIVEAFAAQAAIALRQERLVEQAAEAQPLAEADRMRTALLAAVSHDLRTPLASAKAAVTSLRSDEVEFSAEDRDELLSAADESLDKLGRLVANLLDMSRLQAGALGVVPAALGLEEAVPRALDDLGPASRPVVLRMPDDLPLVHADPGLLERILVNVIGNAVRYSPPDKPPKITASEHGGLVELRVIDHGPGIPDADRDRVFQPFQRLGDHTNHEGVGLGLALSRGLAEAMAGALVPETTPGGGLTMVLTLPSAEADVEPTETRATELADRAIRERLRRWPRDDQLSTRLGAAAATPDLTVAEPARPRRGPEPEPVRRSEPVDLDAADAASPQAVGGTDGVPDGLADQDSAGTDGDGRGEDRLVPTPVHPSRLAERAAAEQAAAEREAAERESTGRRRRRIGRRRKASADSGSDDSGPVDQGDGPGHAHGRDLPRRNRGLRHGTGVGPEEGQSVTDDRPGPEAADGKGKTSTGEDGRDQVHADERERKDGDAGGGR
ncbi:sensor histidine kinase KdpD [Asanoa iriomotensis]|uniref:histidine kinase n=1 Tax=Asanoa iriomotensis TaxID=234613 RepID=A0ABQ4BTU0_9ACTN|nr:sensor histidine kinase [Asanoa iriomotensis]